MPIDQMPSAGGGGVSATGYSAGLPTGGRTPEDPPVWTGHTGGLLDPITGAPKPFTNGRMVPEPASKVIGEFDKWTLEKKKKLARRLIMAGYLNASGRTLDEAVASIPLADLEAAWQQVVLETAQKNANGVRVTPQQLIQQHIDYAREAAKGTDMEKWLNGEDPSATPEKDPNRTETTTSFSRDIFSASEANNVVRQVLQQELGRDPTAEEFQDFKDALNTEQRQNPSKSVTETVYREGDPVRYNTTTTGGINEQEFATEYAQSQPDWAEWQAVGTYFPAAMNALGAGIPGV